MNLCVVGAGHVGLVSGAVFADLGNRVTMLDNDAKRIANLKRGLMPYYEPGLEELVHRNVKEQRLTFTASVKEAVAKSLILFIAVGTPQRDTGEADLTYVEAVARGIAEHMTSYRLIVEKSTVPVQTGAWVYHTIKTYRKRKVPFDVASNPEFLREGTAIQDTMKPDRVVLGVESAKAKQLLTELYKPFGCPIVVTDIASAELIKHASNSFLSMKISFINAVAQVCERSGADIQQVAHGMGLDPRIGRSFLNAGVGYGGFCFEGTESTYMLNSPHVSVQRFQDIFARHPVAGRVEEVDVAVPAGGRMLSFDQTRRRATLTGIRCLTRRWYEGPFVELETMMGRRVRVTANHPIMVAHERSTALEIREARDVREGDLLVSPTRLPTLEPARTINVLETLERRGTALSVRLRATDGAFERIPSRWLGAIPRTLAKSPYDVARHGVMAWGVYRHLQEARGLQVEPSRIRLFTARGKATTIPAVFPVDARLLRWLGYYLAEGWISAESGARGVRERLGISFGRHERGYVRDLHAMLHRYGIRFDVVWFPGAVSTVVSSRLLAWLVRDVLQCGTSSHDKRLPTIAFNVPPRLRRALLQGLFSGDGSITALQGGRNVVFEYATTSKALAEGVVLLLQSLGIVPSLHERWMNQSTRPAYILRVSGLEQLRSLRDVFGPAKRRRIDQALGRYQRRIRQRGFRRRPGYVLLPVRRVKAYEDRTYVYSVETDNQLLVAGTGLVVHNCFPKDVDAFIKIAETLGYDFELLKAVRKINEEAKRSFVAKLKRALWNLKGKTVGVLGLAFKPNTDDMRYAPAIDIIEALQDEGATVKAFDPQAMKEAAHLLPKVTMCKDPYEAARGADCLAVVTEWNEFKELDFGRIKKLLRRPLLLDGRNIYEPEQMRKLGFTYVGVGRGTERSGS